MCRLGDAHEARRRQRQHQPWEGASVAVSGRAVVAARSIIAGLARCAIVAALTVAGLAERAIVTGLAVVARLAVVAGLAIVAGLAVVARLAVVTFDLAVHGLARPGAWLHSQLLRDRGQHQPGPRAR